MPLIGKPVLSAYVFFLRLTTQSPSPVFDAWFNSHNFESIVVNGFD